MKKIEIHKEILTNKKGGKECSRCGKFKAFKYFSRDSRAKDGLRSICKSCDSIIQHKSRQNIRYVDVEYKTCSECGRKLPISKFGIDKTKKDMHRSYCLECMGEQQRHRKRIRIVKQPTSKL